VIGFRSSTEAPEVVATPPVTVTEGAPKKKRKARGNPCPACQGSGVAESQQRIGFEVTNPQLAPGPLPIPDPLPYAVARAIALHRILETVAPGAEPRPIWLALHDSARSALTGVDAEIYRRYWQIRQQAIYGESHFGGGHKADAEATSRSMKAAQDALAALLGAMPQGDDALRLELALCEEAVTLARTELDRSEAFVRLVGGLLGARS
jgi:hypothetical protein